LEEERLCLSNQLKGIRIRTFDEIRTKILKIYNSRVSVAKSVRKKGLVKYLIKVERIHDYLMSDFYRNIESLPKYDELHQFYRDLIAMSCMGNRYNDVIGKIIGYKSVIKKLTKEYSERIRLSFDVPEARKLSREYVGRVLSVFRRLRKDLECLKEVVIELRKLPCIVMSEPKIVVAGMPQVGKSTFVSKVSSAKPEISPFPFTTKEIIVGHLEINYRRIQVIDTPGILDRPLDELNPIERKALVALKNLPDSIVFIIDPYEGSYYSLDRQITLLKNLLTTFSEWKRKMLIAINKIDIVSKKRLELVINIVKSVFDGEIYCMSALKGIGVKEVLDAALKLAGGAP